MKRNLWWTTLLGALAILVTSTTAAHAQCPSDPSNLVASPNCNELRLTWSPSSPSSEVVYGVVRQDPTTLNWIAVGPLQAELTKSILWTEPFMVPGTSVWFKVISNPPPNTQGCENGETAPISVLIDTPHNPTDLFASQTPSGQVKLFWFPAQPNVAYSLHIYRDNEPTAFATVLYSSFQYIFTETVCATQHVYKVQAFGAGCTLGSVSSNPLVFALASPVPIAPAAGAEVGAQGVVLSWSTSCFAASYEYQVAANTNFSPLLASGSGAATQSSPLNGLPTNVALYWRVRACNSGGCSEWSAATQFTIPVIIVTAPNGGENWPPASFQQATWLGSGSVHLEMSPDGGFSWTDFGTTTASPAQVQAPAGWTSTKCLFRVSRTAAPITTDVSDATFKVVPASTHSWGLYPVDAASVRGEWAAMAEDRMGTLTIAYLDRTNGDLLLASRSGSSWAVETIESAGDVGYGVSLTFDSQNRPHVAYLDGNSYLRYAYRSAPGVWNVEPFALNDAGNFYRTSIALDTGGRPLILSRDNEIRTNRLHLNRREAPTSGDWFSLALPNDPGSIYASLQLNGDLPVISYVNYAGELRVQTATAAGTDWTWTDVAVATGAFGPHSLLLDGAGLPWIAYMTAAGQLHLINKTSGGTWHDDIVDASGGQVGTHIALNLFGGAPRISYEANGLLKFARRVGTAWDVDVVDATGLAGEYNQLNMSHIDTPRIVYFDRAAGKLKFAVSPNDVTPPSAFTIGGLPGKTTSMLSWTAPGDDGGNGTANSYEVRRSTGPFTAETFEQATVVASFEPQPAGSAECLSFTALTPCQDYWYAVRAYDDAGNATTSNVLEMTQACAGKKEYFCANKPEVASDTPSQVEFMVFGQSPRGLTAVSYGVPASLAGKALKIAVFDLAGRRVRTLASTTAVEGRSRLEWDQRSESGVRVASGIYFVRFELGAESQTRKVAILR